jgi:hypothetical protein
LRQLLEHLTRDLAAIVVSAREFKVEFDGLLRRQRDFGVDDRFADCCTAPRCDGDRCYVPTNIVDGNRDQQIVNVIAAKMGIAVGRDDFEAMPSCNFRIEISKVRRQGRKRR